MAERYTILERLGRGGVASVFRARDERRNRMVAFKQLRPKHLVGDHTEALIAAFEHEFQVLDQLDHPRIVRVFDYGTADGMPYYTMELLEGETLEQRLPLPLPELCTALRDVASVLALLHARGYVHRDIGPRNVWCARDGRVKLLDFGTMAPIGQAASNLMGTPPYSPPEVVESKPLDGRTDLFSLGALGYRAIVGVDAFPVRRFRDLRRAWRSGPASTPGEHGAAEALSDLIMELLSLDPAARPGSASEVMERLCAVADIEPDSDLRSAQAYLVTPPLLGRDAAVQRIGDALAGATRGQGAALLITGAAQMGHSRLLHHITRLASMREVIPLTVRCRFVGGGPLGLLRALCAEAVAQLPRSARELARPHGVLLANLSDALREELGLAKPPPRVGVHGLALVVDALHDWLAAVSQEQPLVIAIDGVHHCDGGTLGLFTRFAREVRERHMLVALTLDNDAPARAPRVLAQLATHCEELALQPLDADAVQKLTSALFWGAEHRVAVATWLHHATSGVPGTCVALAQHLLDTGLARYDAGRWHLPADPQKQGLPSSLRGVLEQRIAALSPAARRLAQALALVHDDTRPDFQPKLHLDLAEQARLLDASPAEASACLAELGAAGLVRQVAERSVIAHRAMAELLRVALSTEQAEEIHAALAHVLDGRPGEHLSAIRHLQLAGHHAEALRMLRDRGKSMIAAGFDEMRLSLAAECFGAAIEYAREAQLPRDVTVKLVDGLAVVLAVFDWSRVPLIEDELALELEEHEAGGDDDTGRGKRIRRIAGYAGALSYVVARRYEPARLARLVDILDMVKVPGDTASAHAGVASQLLEMIRGCELSREPMQVAADYYGLSDMHPTMQAASVGVHAHAAGVWMAERGMKGANDIAAGFEASVPGIWQAAHLNWLGHGFRCDGAGMRDWELRASAVAPDDLWRRRGFLMVEARMHALLGDILSLKSLVVELDALAEHFEGWLPWRDWARGEYHLLRGSSDEARRDLKRALERAPAGAHAAFGYANAALVALESRAGEHGAAIERARDGLARCRQHRLSRVTGFDHQLALADVLSATGAHEEARRELDAADAVAGAALLGGIHRARVLEARVACAIRANDALLAHRELESLTPFFAGSGIPALAGRHARLLAEARSEQLDATLQLRLIEPRALRDATHSATETATAAGRRPKLVIEE